MAEINLGKVKGDEVTKQSITSALGFPVKEIVIIWQREYNALLPHEQEGERLFFIKDELGKIFYKNQLVWEPNPWDGIFADPLAGQILFDAGLIANPTYSTKEELAEITYEDMMVPNRDLQEDVSIFFESTITTFDELQYFTGFTILDGIFRNCTSLVNAPSIPESVTYMSNTFYGCSSLIEAPIIPEGVTSMWGAFRNCTSLVNAPSIPESVTDMSFTFYGCSNLVEAPIIPEGVASMLNAFSNCSSLVEAPIIPEGITSMHNVFSNCSSLVEAPIIPESVLNMKDTFSGCTSLNGKFIIEAVTPPTINTNTFKGVNVVSIKVPAQSVQAYKTASGWADFADKIFPIT